MRDFLRFYETELDSLNELCREFARRYPKLANSLLMNGDTNADPHVERLIQAIAFLNARIAKKLDDDYSSLAQGLLGMLYGHYVRTVPAYAIAQIDYRSAGEDTITSAKTIPRGTELTSVAEKETACRFCTVYDVTIAPVSIASAKFSTSRSGPADACLRKDVTASIQIDIQSTASSINLANSGVSTLRVYINGEPSLRAVLRDTIFTRVIIAHVEVDGNGRWIALNKPPINEVGYAESDAMLPLAPTAHPAYHLLSEYFAYPDKFDFFDLDLDAMFKAAGVACYRLTLHLALNGVRSNSNAAHLLSTLSASNFLLGCSPIVNLFRQAAAPIRLTHLVSEYALLPDARPPTAYEIYSVDSVSLVRRSGKDSSLTKFNDFYSHRYGGEPARQNNYYLVRRDDDLALISPGHEYLLTLVQHDFSPAKAESGTLSIEMTCSNRDLPSTLTFGRAGGDLTINSIAVDYPIRLLHMPSRPYRFTSERGSYWGLIAHLSLNHRSLSSDGLEAFASMLQLYAPPDSQISANQIEGIVNLAHKDSTAWIGNTLHKAYLNGVEIHMTVDEDAFAGTGLHAFVRTLDHFFGMYVHLNSYTQLIVLSKSTGKELIRCQPRNGAVTLA